MSQIDRSPTGSESHDVPGSTPQFPASGVAQSPARHKRAARGVLSSRRRQTTVIEWFKATLRGNTLSPHRGCERVVIRWTGDEREERRWQEPHRRLIANAGDRFHLHGASADQIALATVTSVRVDGWRETLYVSVGGGVNDGTVHLYKLKRLDRDAIIELTTDAAEKSTALASDGYADGKRSA